MCYVVVLDDDYGDAVVDDIASRHLLVRVPEAVYSPVAALDMRYTAAGVDSKVCW